MVVVGSAPYSDWYVDQVRSAAHGNPRIHCTGAIYDQELLDQLYGHAVTYTHGHSVGGTNPSLLRAMGAGAPVLAYDVEFNREVTADQGYFWANAAELTTIFDDIASGQESSRLADLSDIGQRRVATAYQWEDVTNRYEDMILSLVKGGMG